jgi:hypothetical protein
VQATRIARLGFAPVSVLFLEVPTDDREFLVQDTTQEGPYVLAEVPIGKGEIAIEVVVPLDESRAVVARRRDDKRSSMARLISSKTLAAAVRSDSLRFASQVLRWK